MKKVLIHLSAGMALMFSLFACESDSGIGQFDSVVIDSANSNDFQQITFIVQLKHSDYGYLNVSVIDSMELYVNAKYWGTFSSEVFDTTGYTNRVEDNLPYADENISYLFIAPYVLETSNIETAGDVVNYLLDRIILTPGEYVCEIKNVKFKDLDGNLISKNTRIFADFEVIENTTSAFVGNIEIPLN